MEKINWDSRKDSNLYRSKIALWCVIRNLTSKEIAKDLTNVIIALQLLFVCWIPVLYIPEHMCQRMSERDLFVYVNNFFWDLRIFFTLIHRGILFENTIIEIRWLAIMHCACLVFKFKFLKNSSNIISSHD